MTGELSSLGVGPDAERLYRRILRAEPQSLDAHATALGWGRGHAHSAYRALVAARLVADGDEGTLVPEAPRVAIGRLIERENSRLEARRRELEDARAVIADFAGEHLARRSAGTSAPELDLISRDLLVSTVEHAVRSIPGTIRKIVLTPTDGPASDEVVLRLLQGELSRGRTMRAIYPLSVLRDPDPTTLTWLRTWADVGQQQRLLDDVPHEFVIYGDELLFAKAEWGAPDAETVAVRSPLLVQAFTRVFDDAWQVSLPVPSTVGESVGDERLLALLAAGYKDEAIARYLGVSLRTVRRRVAMLMEELGAQTRFQLGSAAERRGLLEQAKE